MCGGGQKIINHFFKVKKMYKVLKIICVVFFLFTQYSYCFSTENVRDEENGIFLDFPCSPEKTINIVGNVTVTIYSCENPTDFMFLTSTTRMTDFTPIKYRDEDLKKSLKVFLVGNLSFYGFTSNQIHFGDLIKIGRKYPAVFYSTDALQDKMISEGISGLVDGKHIKISVLYEKRFQNIGRKKLNSFLDTYFNN